MKKKKNQNNDINKEVKLKSVYEGTRFAHAAPSLLTANSTSTTGDGNIVVDPPSTQHHSPACPRYPHSTIAVITIAIDVVTASVAEIDAVNDESGATANIPTAADIAAANASAIAIAAASVIHRPSTVLLLHSCR